MPTTWDSAVPTLLRGPQKDRGPKVAWAKAREAANGRRLDDSATRVSTRTHVPLSGRGPTSEERPLPLLGPRGDPKPSTDSTGNMSDRASPDRVPSSDVPGTVGLGEAAPTSTAKINTKRRVRGRVVWVETRSAPRP